MSNAVFDASRLPVPPPMTPEERALKVTKTVLTTGTSVEQKRAELLAYFHATYTLYERLFEPLSEKAFVLRADRLRHPLIFYYGHTACFFINKLRLAKVVRARVNKRFESMFAIGVDEMSWDDLPVDGYEWPSVAEVKAYRDEVRAVVEEAIQRMPLKLPITWDDPAWAILMGIEHERIHLETSSVLMRQLPLSELRPSIGAAPGTPGAMWPLCPAGRFGGEPRAADEREANELLPVRGVANLRLGKDVDHPAYGWDNEYGRIDVSVPAFRAQKRLVTNAEFLEFVLDGGYERDDVWGTDEGRRWAQYCRELGKCYPRFWVPEPASGDADASGGDADADASATARRPTRFRMRTMLDEIDMPWDWPVETNQLEAKAYANWLAARTGLPLRLPQEDEWYALHLQELGGAAPEAGADHPYWKERAPGNLNLEYWASSNPVTMFPATPGGFHDVVGNVWQHTETPIDSYPGFRVHHWYDDFSVPTFDLQHNMIKGGSWISTGNEATVHSRYAFRRHFYQHAGFRLVESTRKVQLRSDVFERDENVAMYASNHYAAPAVAAPSTASSAVVASPALFQVEIARLVAEAAQRHGVRRGRVLDLGCAVGRTTYELARHFEYALGLDFSARFIRHAVALQSSGVVHYTQVEEGDRTSEHTRTLAEFGLEEVKTKCEFYQADACNLDPRYGGYDVVLAANLIDQLYDPRQFLAVVPSRVRPGGLLVLTSAYAWDVAFTPRELWLGACAEAERAVGRDPATQGVRSTLDVLRDTLGEHFELVETPRDLDSRLRLSARRYQHDVVEMTVWRRRGVSAPLSPKSGE